MLKLVKSKILYLVMALCLILEVGTTTASVAYAETESKTERIENDKVTKAEMRQATNRLAAAMKKAAEENKNMSGEDIGTTVFAYAIGDASKPDPTSSIYATSLFSYSGFGKCMLRKSGLGMLVNSAKYIFNRKVKRLLASRSWKRASKLIIRGAVKASKRYGAKVAKKLLKTIAKRLAPGIGWGSLAWYAVQCGWQQHRR